MDIGNERFLENAKRIERFRIAFKESLAPKMAKRNPEGREWEDAASRRERMREEGLRRKALKAEDGEKGETVDDEDMYEGLE